MTDKKNSQALIIFLEDQNRDKVQRQFEGSLTDEQMGQLYRAFLEDTINNCLSLSDVEIRINYPAGITGDIVSKIVSDLKKSLAGKPLKLISSNRFRVVESRGESVGERMCNAFRNVFDEGFDKVVMIGCVTPTLSRKIVMDAFKKISKLDLVIGPTLEGSYYLLAMSRPISELFDEVDWADDTAVYGQMAAASNENGYNWEEMDLWYDLRQPEDLEFLVRDINQFRLVGDERSAVRTEQVLGDILKNLPS
jgi:glycosyltransferase A (GT-A) superfamily protein (DUF2064 family)